jgi:RNA 3'-terminal phosphate cyclase
VGLEAAGQLAAWWHTGAAVDLHLADQLLPYLVLAEGPSEVLAEATTRHLTTNAWVGAVPACRGDAGGRLAGGGAR